MSWLTKLWSGGAEPPSESDDAPAPGESGAGPQCPGYSVEAGFDYTGGDIGLDPKTVGDAAACCSLCETTRLCNAYTFVVATSACWLKSRRRGVRAEAQPNSLVSGYRIQLKQGAGDTRLSRLSTGRPMGAHAAPRRRMPMGGGGGGGAFVRRQQETQSARLLEQAATFWQEQDAVDPAAEARSTMRLCLPLADDPAGVAGSSSPWAQWAAPDAAPMTLMLGALPARRDRDAPSSVSAPPLRWRAASAARNVTTDAPPTTATTLHRAPLMLPSAAAAAPSARLVQLHPAKDARRGAYRRHRLAAHALPPSGGGGGSGGGGAHEPAASSLGFVLFGATGAEASPALISALRAEVLGRDGAALALHTGDLCAPPGGLRTAGMRTAASTVEVGRCLSAISPLVAAAPLMPAPGPADLVGDAGCDGGAGGGGGGGGAWADRWWEVRLAESIPPSSSSSSSSGAGCPGAQPTAARSGAGPWYSFVRGTVLFVALSSGHPMGDGSEQHRFAQRAARLRPAGGWVVAYAHDGAASAPLATRVLRADALLAAQGCASGGGGGHAGCIAPPPDGYARVRVHGGGGESGRLAVAHLEVERVRAADGAVLSALQIPQKVKS